MSDNLPEFLSTFSGERAIQLDRTRNAIVGVISADFLRLLLNTPVDRGHLVWNWVLTLNGGHEGEFEGVDPTGGSLVAQRELPKLAAYSLLGTLSVAADNDTLYGPYVNDGTEKIEPRLFVEKTQAESDNLEILI